MSPTDGLKMKAAKPVVHQTFSRDQICLQDHAVFVAKFSPDILSPADLRQYYDSLVVTVRGYENDPRELCEISEVRQFFQSLHKEWPHALFFLNTAEADLKTYFYCLLPSVNVQRRAGTAGSAIHYGREELFQAIGHSILFLETTCEQAGLGAGEFRKRSRATLRYFGFLKP